MLLEQHIKGIAVETEKPISLVTLLFGAAYGLNNPLNSISTFCQILKEEIESGDIVEWEHHFK